MLHQEWLHVVSHELLRKAGAHWYTRFDYRRVQSQCHTSHQRLFLLLRKLTVQLELRGYRSLFLVSRLVYYLTSQ